MKQCGQCGTQNLDQQTACSACGTPLPAAVPSALGGTLVIQPPEPPQPPPPAAAPQPRGNLKGTMIGLAPPIFPASASPSAAAEPRAVPARPLGATMIGMAPPNLTSPLPSGPEAPYPSPPPAPPAGEPHASAPRIASAQKTVLGVARPGIAPLNPGQPKSNPPPPTAAALAPLALPGPAAVPLIVPPSSRGPSSPRRPPPARITLGATLAIVGAAMLLAMAVLAYFMLRGHGSVTARAVLDAKGKEVLELSCSECPDGTKVWIDMAPVAFRSGKATLGLQQQLKVGENPIVLVLERPGRSREEIALALPIEYRVRGSTEGLAQEEPRVSVLATVLAGTKLEVDGKPVTPNADAIAPVRFDYDVTAEVSGPEATVKTLERSVPYKATSASGAVQQGQVEVRIGITPLIVDAPGASIVVGGKELVIAGRTAPGAALKIGGQAVTLDAEGRFVSKQPLVVGDNAFNVRATLQDHAPRLIRVVARRSDNLDRDAALARSMAQASYADVVNAPEASVGRTLWLQGPLFDARHDGYSSVLLLDVKNGCKKGPCLAKVIYGAETAWEKGRALQASGKLVRFVDGPRSGERIPEVRADLVVAGGK
ncbi:MAG: zinc ribbon domain-containing protein [Myxococcales bacterium]|nr:MAG: zinc ribbon domain-containing protein [Myxococcales bacterium]